LDFGFQPNQRSNLETVREAPLEIRAGLNLLDESKIANCKCFQPPCVSHRQLIPESDLYLLAMSLLSGQADRYNSGFFIKQNTN
jgi:hypothetical protein